MSSNRNYSRLVLLLLLSLSLLLPLRVQADEPAALIQELKFDQKERVLSGKSVPNANIVLADLVAEIVADDQGHFSVMIPADLTQSVITVNDYLNDQSTDVAFDFNAGTIATEASQLEQSTSSSNPDASIKDSSVVIKPAEQQMVTVPEKKGPNVILWGVILVALISATVLALLYDKQQKEKKRLAELKKNKQRKRKKRRKRKSTTLQ